MFCFSFFLSFNSHMVLNLPLWSFLVFRKILTISMARYTLSNYYFSIVSAFVIYVYECIQKCETNLRPNK